MSYVPLPQQMNPYPCYYPGFTGHQACTAHNACKLSVEGKGSIKAQPDTAVITLGVSTENKLLMEAQKENAQIVGRVLDTLHGMGIPPEDIQTQTYTIEPQYDYIEGEQVFRGYRVVHTLQITTSDIGRTGEIVDAAVESGANIVSNISFSISDPSGLYRQALDAAIDDAVGKAEAIGRQLRVNISQVPVQITEEHYEYAVPLKPALMQAAGTTTPVQPGQIEITAAVRAVFTYVPV